MYNKLFTKILDSSVWLEPDYTRITWITLLASMNEDGFCAFACEENLALRARLRPSSVRKALETLAAPDSRSSDPDHEGRRIERVPGGWMVLNADKYRKLARRVQILESGRERVSRFRQKLKETQKNSTNLSKSREISPTSSLDSPACNAAVTPSIAVSNEVNTNTPPTPSKRKRKTREDVIDGFSEAVAAVVNPLLEEWPTKRTGDNSKIQTSVAEFGDRVNDLLQKPGLTPAILLEAARLYLKEERQWPHAPQYFFGPGNGKGPPWRGFAMLAYTRNKQETGATA